MLFIDVLLAWDACFNCEKTWSQQVVDTVEVQDYTNEWAESVKGPIETTNVSKVVQYIIYDSLDDDTIFVKFENDASWHRADLVFGVWRWPDRLLFHREDLWCLLVKKADWEKGIR